MNPVLQYALAIAVMLLSFWLIVRRAERQAKRDREMNAWAHHGKRRHMDKVEREIRRSA